MQNRGQTHQSSHFCKFFVLLLCFCKTSLIFFFLFFSTVDGGTALKSAGSVLSVKSLHKALLPIAEANKQHNEQLRQLQGQVVGLSRNIGRNNNALSSSGGGGGGGGFLTSRDLYLIAFMIVVQMLILWVMKWGFWCLISDVWCLISAIVDRGWVFIGDLVNGIGPKMWITKRRTELHCYANTVGEEMRFWCLMADIWLVWLWTGVGWGYLEDVVNSSCSELYRPRKEQEEG